MSEDRLTTIEQKITEIKDIKKVLAMIIKLAKEVTEIKYIKKVLAMIIKLEKAVTEIKKVLAMITQLEKEIIDKRDEYEDSRQKSGLHMPIVFPY